MTHFLLGVACAGVGVAGWTAYRALARQPELGQVIADWLKRVLTK